MSRAVAILPGRPLAAVGLGALAPALGVLAVVSPKLALIAIVGLPLCVAMMADLTVAVVLFTGASFGSAFDLGPLASAMKALGLVLAFSWVASTAVRRCGSLRGLVQAEPWMAALAVLFVAWSALSAVWAGDAPAALGATGRYALDVLLLPIVFAGVRRCADVRAVAWAFVAGAALSTVYGAVTGYGGDATRLAGAVGDPNETAAALVASGMLALALAASSPAGSAARLLGRLGVLASVVGLAATASRGGLIALAAAMVVAVALAGRWRGRTAAWALIAAMLLGGWFLHFAPQAARERITSADSSGRTTIWTVAVRTIEAHPLAGVGTANFRYQAVHYLLQPGATQRADLIVDDPKVAHNVYLEMWADLGVVGVLLFGGLLACAVRCSLRAVLLLRRAGLRREELVARALVIALAGMLVADAFISDVYSKQLWLLLGLAPAQLAAARAAVARARAAAPAEEPDGAAAPIVREVTA